MSGNTLTMPNTSNPFLRGIASQTVFNDPSHLLPISAVARDPTGEVLAGFLGTPIKTFTEGSVSRSVFYQSENAETIERLPTTVIGLVAETQTYINRDVLPIKITDKLTHKWNTIEFLPESLTHVPYFGVARAGERIENAFETRAQRYGQFFELEDGLFQTTLGMQEYEMNVAKFSVSINDYAKWLAWSAVTQPSDITPRQYTDLLNNPRELRRYLLEEKMFFAMAYKSDTGFQAAFQAHYKEVVSRVGVPPTILVIPRDKTALLTTGTNLKYHQYGGDESSKLLHGDGLITKIGGVDVYEPPTFSLSKQMNSVSPLDTEVRLGSYHIAKYVGGQCQDALFDINADQFTAPGDIYEVMACCGLFEGEEQWGADAGAVLRADPLASLRLKVAARGFDTVHTRTAGQWAAEFQKQDKFDILFVMPFDGYRMQGEVYIVGNSNVGFTTMSIPRIVHGFDAATMKHLINMSLNMGVVLQNPKQILVRYNAYYNGIIGGGNVEFITPDVARRLKDETGFRDPNIDRASVYVLVVPKGKGKYGSSHIDIRATDPVIGAASYPMASFYSSHYGWDGIDNSGELYGSMDGLPIAHVCYKKEFNRIIENSNTYNFTPGNTQHGPNVGPGAKEVREKGLSQCNYNTSFSR